MLPFVDPMEFVHRSPAFERLGACYDEDMQRARTLTPARKVPGATIVMLPDEAWARRAIGVLANELTRPSLTVPLRLFPPMPKAASR
jgi:hypothetical protein